LEESEKYYNFHRVIISKNIIPISKLNIIHFSKLNIIHFSKLTIINKPVLN